MTKKKIVGVRTPDKKNPPLAIIDDIIDNGVFEENGAMFAVRGVLEGDGRRVTSISFDLVMKPKGK